MRASEFHLLSVLKAVPAVLPALVPLWRRTAPWAKAVATTSPEVHSCQCFYYPSQVQRDGRQNAAVGHGPLVRIISEDGAGSPLLVSPACHQPLPIAVGPDIPHVKPRYLWPHVILFDIDAPRASNLQVVGQISLSPEILLRDF